MAEKGKGCEQIVHRKYKSLLRTCERLFTPCLVGREELQNILRSFFSLIILTKTKKKIKTLKSDWRSLGATGIPSPHHCWWDFMLSPYPWGQFGNLYQGKKQVCFSPAIPPAGIWPMDLLADAGSGPCTGDPLQHCLGEKD